MQKDYVGMGLVSAMGLVFLTENFWLSMLGGFGIAYWNWRTDLRHEP